MQAREQAGMDRLRGRDTPRGRVPLQPGVDLLHHVDGDVPEDGPACQPGLGARVHEVAVADLEGYVQTTEFE